MIAYKGLTKDMVAALGSGQKVLKAGETVVEENSKTGRTGWHCTENPFDCLDYFPLGRGNRYFLVEAAGNIDEDDQNQIACTELTLLEELSIRGLAFRGMAYMVEHPERTQWQQYKEHIKVAPEEAEANEADDIAIARGTCPRVRGPEGSILGLILENQSGEIETVRLFVPAEDQADRWYTLEPDRTLRKV